MRATAMASACAHRSSPSFLAFAIVPRVRVAALSGARLHVEDHALREHSLSAGHEESGTGTGCRAVDGSASTTVTPSGGDARGVETTLADVKMCKNPDGNDACPSGAVTHTGKVSEATVTCAYDGSATAAITGPGGRTWEVDLVCPAYEPG